MVCSNGVLHGDAQHTAAFRIHGGFPQLIRVHLAQTFITLNGEATTGLFHQPLQRLLEAGHRLTALTALDKGIVFDQTAQLLAESTDTTVFRTGHELLIQRIVGIHTVGTHADHRLELVQFAVLVNVELPLAAVLLVLVQIGHQGVHPTGHGLLAAEVSFGQRRLIDQRFQQRAREATLHAANHLLGRVVLRHQTLQRFTRQRRGA
ncbi:hypothetical protein D3C76_1261350 [compost metagenome]